LKVVGVSWISEDVNLSFLNGKKNVQETGQGRVSHKVGLSGGILLYDSLWHAHDGWVGTKFGEEQRI
jgi:hypothetical protein